MINFWSSWGIDVDSPIYVDFDDTLIHPETDRRGRVIRIHPRPHAGEFLLRLSRHAPVYILSHAYLEHVMENLPLLGPDVGVVEGVLAREDLQPVIEQVEEILWSGASEQAQERALQKITPIAPAGVMFDDQPVGSYLYKVKASALGIGPGMWIQVKPYNPPTPNDTGLERAYQKFKRMFVGAELGRRRTAV